MGRADYFAAGQWNFLCQQCGEKFKSSAMRRQWDGLKVCPRCYEPRNQQDLIRPIKDDQAVPWSAPVQAPIFINKDFSLTPQILDGTTLDGTTIG